MPRRPVHEFSAEEARVRPRGLQPRVLVVDDDRAMCELLEIGLSKRGFEVVWRTQALTALHMLPGEQIDAVVVDLNMPDLKGTELCSLILAERPDLPIIVITAFGGLDTALEAIRAGAYDFLAKPFELDTLVLALHQAIQRRMSQDRSI